MDHVLSPDDYATGIICGLCYDPLDYEKKAGSFKYNSSQGMDFTVVPHPEAFLNKKNCIPTREGKNILSMFKAID